MDKGEIRPLIGIIAFILVVQTSFSQQNKPFEVIAFQNVNLVPMTSEEVLADQTVLIKNSRIAEIGKSGKVKIPKGALIIDGKRKYLMPGLTDMHTHYGETLEKSYLNLFVAHGVTTIRDLPQGSPPTLLSLREEIRKGSRLGPQLFVANHITGLEPDPSLLIEASKKCGYDGVKFNSYFSTKEFLETAAVANRSGVYAFGHLPFLVGFGDILSSGYREASHVLELAWYLTNTDIQSGLKANEVFELILKELFSQFDKYLASSGKDFEDYYGPKIKALADRIGNRDFAFTTTLITDYDIMNKMLNIDTIKYSNYARYIPKSFWENINSGKDKHLNMFSDPRYSAMVYKMACMILHELHAQKRLLVLGTDVGPTYLSYIPGLSVHKELELLVDNGLTPYQALLTATRNAAEVTKKMCGRDDFGTVEVGKRSDLILLGGNPLADIRNTQMINGVFIQGAFFERGKLDSIKNLPKQGLRNLIMERYKTGGIDEAIALYRSLKNDNYYNLYFYNENTLLFIAYELFKMNSLEDALKLFLLNTEEYPAAPNAFDSLGELYLKMDKKELAIKSYKKALELDPGFESSVKALKELEK
jgi:tetratricopeptide (TPR) repeat protein/putative transposon-encoded protein